MHSSDYISDDDRPFLKALIIQSFTGNEFGRPKRFYSILLSWKIFVSRTKPCRLYACGIVNEPHQIALVVRSSLLVQRDLLPPYY